MLIAVADDGDDDGAVDYDGNGDDGGSQQERKHVILHLFSLSHAGCIESFDEGFCISGKYNPDCRILHACSLNVDSHIFPESDGRRVLVVDVFCWGRVVFPAADPRHCRRTAVV